MQIFINGNFISLNNANEQFTVLVEQKGIINYIGNNIPSKYQGHKTTDLMGKTIVPAFGDTHLHFLSDSFFRAGLNLRGTKNYLELKKRILEYLKNNKVKFIIGFGLSPHLLEEQSLPSRQYLDQITSIPLFLVKYDGHAAIGNTPLINLLPQNTKMADGFVEDLGHFYLESFFKAADYLSKKISPITLIKNIISNAKHLAAKGYSFLHVSEGTGFPLNFDITLLQILNYFIPQHLSIFFQTTDLNKISHRKFKRVGGCFATAIDGCFGSTDAALLEAYTNDHSNFGNLFFSQKDLNNFVLNAHKKGLQIALHAIGDKAIEQAINSFEQAQEIYPRTDHRHIIIHACLLNDNLIKRIAKLKLHLAIQTAFLNWQEEPMSYLECILGKRTKNIMPLKTILDNGIIMANGSDAPCTSPDAILGIYNACNHPIPEESISPLEALKMFTCNAAQLSFEEGSRGTLEVDKNCDFVILSKNLLDISPDTINTTKILDVYISGKKIHE